MATYRRNRVPGGIYFFTVVTHDRRPWLCDAASRVALREAIASVRHKYPFTVEAWVLLPDHFHCIWRLPPGVDDFATRMRLIKTGVTKHPLMRGLSAVSCEHTAESRRKKEEGGLWQRRFWEHTISDEKDFEAHCRYIHYNPVKHGLCGSPRDWPYSTFQRFVARGIYPEDWGGVEVSSVMAEGVGME